MSNLFYPKALSSALLVAACLSAAQIQGAQLTISQQPLFLTQTIAPNLILTLDNSNSMKWGFVPDSIGYTANGLRSTRRVKSGSYNPMYYNPGVTYRIPKKVTFNSGQITNTDYPVSTTSTFDFTKVLVNGFNSARGSLNMTNDYRVAWEYDTSRGQDTNYSSGTNYGTPTGTINYLAENPSADFSVSANITTNNGTATLTPAAGLTIIIKRTGNSSCTATLNGTSVSCTGKSSSSTYSVDLTKLGVPAYYYLFDPTLSGCSTTSTDNDNCYKLVIVSSNSGTNGADERQNFAIWYAFYRNRSLATQSAANLAFFTLPDSVRLTWQDLSNCTTLNSSSSCKGISYSGSNLFRTFANQNRANFFNWVADVNFNTGTPLRTALNSAGSFLQNTGVNGPYAYDPGTTQSPEYACRPSYHIMMTDGKWNTDTFNVGNVDNSSVNLPDGTQYSPRAPYKDSASNTLADLAFKYWATDLQPNISNSLKPYIRAGNTNATTQYWDPQNDPATWQHMVTFTMGLGLSKALTNPAWGTNTYDGDYTGLYNGTINWPSAASDSDNNVYDLWHAAINSRGEFFSVDSPQEMVEAFTDIISRIADRTASAASPAVTSPLVSSGNDGDNTNTYTYTPSFSSQDWSGDLIKYQQNLVLGTQSQVWSAKTLLLARDYTQRNIKMRSNSGNTLTPFLWSNLSTTQQASFNRNLAGDTDSNGQARVNYLRGDRSNEGTLFRARTNILGDIIDSSPIVVGPPSHATYIWDALEGQTASASNSYSTFKSNKVTRATYIYVGANDGMLHAFDSNGTEAFAFVPTTALDNMNRIPDLKYTGSQHQYFVDGSPVTEDVYFNNAWHTVLIGSMRAGGRSLFALDITDPSNISLLWEINANTTGYSDLGYTFAQPTITRLHNGKWAVVTSNGYNSTNDRAVLYLIDIQDGSLIKSITVSDGTSTPNGLSSARVVDMDGDGISDYVYAGDIRGNLWRFDLFGGGDSTHPYGTASSASANNFVASFGGTPLFKAVTGSNAFQPITSTPRVVRHPTGTGLIVIFGTGKYIESADAQANTSKAMSIYGIWDRQTAAQSASSTPTVARSNLQSQTITTVSNASIINGTTRNIRTMTNNAVVWTTTTGSTTTVNKYGWYVDLPSTGEMVVTDPYTSGKLLLTATLTPNTDPCADGVTTWLMAMNPLTGGSPLTDALDLNNDGLVNSTDRTSTSGIIAGTQFPGATGGISIGYNPYAANGQGSMVACGTEGCVNAYDGIQAGRQSWRILQKED